MSGKLAERQQKIVTNGTLGSLAFCVLCAFARTCSNELLNDKRIATQQKLIRITTAGRQKFFTNYLPLSEFLPTVSTGLPINLIAAYWRRRFLRKQDQDEFL